MVMGGIWYGPAGGGMTRIAARVEQDCTRDLGTRSGSAPALLLPPHSTLSHSMPVITQWLTYSSFILLLSSHALGTLYS
jgi:hypothetical protein